MVEWLFRDRHIYLFAKTDKIILENYYSVGSNNENISLFQLLDPPSQVRLID
jgi:hypothetical protein